MLDTYIKHITTGQSLTQSESYQATLSLLSANTAPSQSANTAPSQIVAYLTALHTKGETTAEVLGVIQALQAHMLTVPTTRPTLDIVGTGGDAANSINISTGSAILAASCGVPIAKHGNRAVSSQCGSADVLEALGINIEMPIPEIAICLDTLNITFCFAPRFHPALAQLRDIRRQIGTPTIFNLAAPFLNPAQAQHYLLGVFSPKLLKPFADILAALPLKKSAVIHSDGLDEITCSGITQVIEIVDGKQKAYTLDPIQLGFQYCSKEALKGKDAAYNALALKTALAGKPGPVADTLILNAAMAVYLYGRTKTLMEAIRLIREYSLAGKGLTLLDAWKQYTYYH